MLHRFVVVAVLLAFVSSCSTSKKAAKYSRLEENLDTLEVTVSRENSYRAAATKYFDLINTKLEVRFDYQKQYLNGRATITLKPHFYPQTELVLDAKQFDIHQVSLVTGEGTSDALQYSYDSLQLKIKLGKTFTRDQTLKVYIDYTAKPNERKTGGSAAINEDKGLYFINPTGADSSKPTQIWTQGETESNSCWFPTIDKPNQKSTDEIYITHLKKYVSLSNGVLVSSTSVNDSLVTDYWKMDLPHAPYLFMMAIGDFKIVQDRWRDVPVNYYLEKDYAPYAKQIFGNTPQMIEFFSQKLGFDFPWPKYSQVVVRDYVSGAMENTSATLHGEFIQRNTRELLDENHEDVISHELFHQWFGDLVTTESWSNTPLNESFATYGEYLWNEYKYGREFADYKLRDDYRQYMAEAKSKNVDLIRYHYDDKEDMFDSHSYAKGGQVLHYLRKVVGDEAFFKSLELYLKTNQFKAVEIQNLRLAFEEVTGTDLNWFFNEWFLNSGHPVLDIHYSYDRDSIFVTVEQKHNTDKELTYQLPFKLGVWHGKEFANYDFTLKRKSQTFAIASATKPDLVDFDPERAILCERKDTKSPAGYVFEYRNAPYFSEQLEALRNLAEIQKDSAAAKLVLTEALHDKFFYLRQYAITKIEPGKAADDSILAVIEQLAKEDKESSVRKEAITKLSKATGSKSRYAGLFEASVGDSSYQVSSAALKALAEADSKKAMTIAKKMEGDKNSEVVNAVADVYAKEGDVSYQDYFEKKLKTATGFGKYTLLYYYANFLTRMERPVVISGINVIEQQGMSTDNHFISGGAKGALKRISKDFEDKKKTAKTSLATEQSKTEKVTLQETMNDCDLIIGSVEDALNRLNKEADSKKN